MSTRVRAVLTAALMVPLLSFGLVAVSSPARAALPSCTGVKHAVVTDIDETLTTSDSELFKQMIFPAYDPLERADGSELMSAYAARGYRVVYITGRPDEFWLGDGRSERQGTTDWLAAHGFPLRQDLSHAFLSPDVVTALYPRGYKGEAVKALQAQGYAVDYAYGNAQTDFEAYADAGVAKSRTFSIGKLAGFGGTQPISGEGYTAHMAAHMAGVPAVCDPAATPVGPPAACPLVAYDNLFVWLLQRLFPIAPAPRVLPCH